MTGDRNIEAQAADALLDRRLKLSLPAPWWMRMFGKRTITFYMHRPVCSTILRMSALFVRIGIDIEALKKGDLKNLMEYISKNLVAVSRLIALGMLHGSIKSMLFNRPLARYLRNHMDLQTMAELMKVIVVTAGGENFVSIITSASNLRLTEKTIPPTESQQTKTGS